MTIPDDAERAEFDAMWPELWLQLIPGEFDIMDAHSEKIWRGVVEAAWQAGRAALRASTQAQLAAMARALEDVAWRIEDIRDMLLSEGMNGKSRYGIDELSTPAVALLRAYDVAVRAAKDFAALSVPPQTNREAWRRTEGAEEADSI